MHFDAESLARIVVTLEQAGFVIQKIRDGLPGYELTPSGRRIFEGGSLKK
jgi:predicted transcriptional regulator